MPPGFPQGIEGVRLFFSAFREGMPDVQVRIDEIVAEDDRAAVATRIEGTHTGALMGIEPTGRRISVRGIDMVRVADGRIVEHRADRHGRPAAPAVGAR